MGQRGRPRHPDVLTPREQDVLALLRDGLTNEQIASRLSISFETAKHHVATILSKLNVSTREEAANWRDIQLPSRWSLGRAMLTIAGLSTVAAAVAGLALLSWGLSRAGTGAATPIRPLDQIVQGRVYYLPPADEANWISSPANVDGAGVILVTTPAEMMSATHATAVIVDQSWFDQISSDWLTDRRTEGTVIVGGRANMDDLLRWLNVGVAAPGWGRYGDDRNFFSLYSECVTSGRSSKSQGENYLDRHGVWDFRLMLSMIQNQHLSHGGCGSSASPTPPRPSVSELAPASFLRLDPDADPKGGTPVYVVDHEVSVTARAEGVARIWLSVSRFASDLETLTIEATPDANGDIASTFALPHSGIPYIVSIHHAEPVTGLGDPNVDAGDAAIVALPTPFRVMAER